MSMITLIGIDPSMSNTALVAISYPAMKVIDYKLIETNKSKHKQQRVVSDDISRAREVYDGVHRFIKHHRTIRNVVVAAETPTGSQSSSGMKSYGISAAIIGSIDPCTEVTPTEVKMFSVGNKTASKDDMIKWGMETHPEMKWMVNKSTGKPLRKCEHLADAIGAIYAMMQTNEFKTLTSFIQDN